jgi:hypothetical protein
MGLSYPLPGLALFMPIASIPAPDSHLFDPVQPAGYYRDGFCKCQPCPTLGARCPVGQPGRPDHLRYADGCEGTHCSRQRQYQYFERMVGGDTGGEALEAGKPMWCLPFRFKGDERVYAVVDFTDLASLLKSIK